MAFKTIDEVVKRWVARYSESGMEYDLLPSPGYVEAELILLEEGLSTVLHPSLKHVFSKVKLDHVDLSGLWFGPRTLDNIKDLSSSDLRNRYFVDGLVIGVTDGYLIIVDNGSGIVYAAKNSRLDMLEHIADNLEECICVAATLSDSSLKRRIDEDDEDNYSNVISDVDKFLADNSIKNGPYFLANNGKLDEVNDITPGTYVWHDHGIKHEEPGNGSFFWKELLLGWQ